MPIPLNFAKFIAASIVLKQKTIRIILLSSLLTLIFLGGYAQNLIVTNANDTLNFPITSGDDDFTYFICAYDGDLPGYSNMKITGSTVGIAGDIGYQIGLFKAMSLGVALSVTNGTLSKIETHWNDGYSTTTDLKDDQKENLGRIDLSLGLIFHR